MASQTRVYKLYASGAGNGAATLTIGKDGRITAIKFDIVGVNGANVQTAEIWEVALNNSTGVQVTNDTVTSIAQCAASCNVASSTTSANLLIAGLSIPVQAGDRLVLNGTSFLNAFSSRGITAHIYVEQ